MNAEEHDVVFTKGTKKPKLQLFEKYLRSFDYGKALNAAVSVLRAILALFVPMLIYILIDTQSGGGDIHDRRIDQPRRITDCLERPRRGGIITDYQIYGEVYGASPLLSPRELAAGCSTRYILSPLHSASSP